VRICHRLFGSRHMARRAICSCFAIVFSGLSTLGSHADGSKQVLIVHANQSVLPATVITDTAIRRELQAHLPGRLSVFTEYLDTERFPGSEQAARMEAFLREKYTNHPIDLLISTGPEALDFLLQRRASLFINTPLIYALVSDEGVRARNLPDGVAGVVSRYDLGQTAQLALQLQPDARHLVVVTGASALDKVWEERARRTLRTYEERLDIRYLSSLPMPQLLQQLGQLPSHTIVLYLTTFRDGAGHREDLATPLQSLGESMVFERLKMEEHRGSEHWIRVIGRTKFGVSGQPGRITGVIIDVTPEKAAERETTLWRHELMYLTRVATLGELSGAIAHELNQPLTAILSNADAAHLLLMGKDCDLA
jgi:PAS domain-containing protein